jgi:hypothetical protein
MGPEQSVLPHVSKERIAELIKEERVDSRTKVVNRISTAGRRRLTEHNVNRTSSLWLDVKAEAATGAISDLSSAAESHQKGETHNWNEHHPYFAPQYMNQATQTLVLG